MGSVYKKNTIPMEAAVEQKSYTIGGVPVIFPYKAYPSQIAMMDKIIKCLNKKHNCLLESPTGSGKSLALLCSTLAWLKKTERDILEMENSLKVVHPDSYGDAVTDDVNQIAESTYGSAPEFEKYNSYRKSNVKSETKGTALSKNTVKEKFVLNRKINGDEEIGSEARVSFSKFHRFYNFKNKLSPCINDRFKRRSAKYIDFNDLVDLQPVKKKIFPASKKAHQIIIQSQDYKYATSVPGTSLQQDIKIDSPYKQSKCSNLGCAFEDKTLTKSEGTTKIPKIYFGTRTHKQIGQIIRELRKTPYGDVKMTILSGRERTCIHPKNSKSHNKNEGCDELIKREGGPACGYYRNIQKFGMDHTQISTPFDLEDLVSTCRRKTICPYFGARELLQTAEIVFCPYNYLVDPLIRSALSICLQGDIIIMDEAHNIEDSAREAASGCISLSELREVVVDVLQIGQLKHEDSEPYMYIAKVLETLRNWLENSQEFDEYVSFDSSCKVWSGSHMLSILNDIGLGPNTFPDFQSNYRKIDHKENETEKNKHTESQDLTLSGSSHVCLKNLTEILSCMYKNNFMFVHDYRCVIVKSKTNSHQANVSFSETFRRKPLLNTFEITMNLWCLNPAVTFSSMKNVRSIIVASGTLAPLTSFQSELGIPFHISLEAHHVVNSENMWVGTIGKGPSNTSLNGNFQSASTFIFQDNVGNIVLEICTLIPYGVLCFLPSYAMLDKLVNRWQITGLWDKLLSKKVVLCEPRQTHNFQLIMQEFHEAIKDSEDNDSGDIKGALFLAVCRGKVSEGLDFTDNNARAVITIGIPFPNIKDAQVDLKKKYNDEHSSKNQIVTGSAWYEMQAFRAINQALGRCIRHKNDFGALIIVDERFQMYDRYTAALSKWIKKEIRHYSTFYDALNSLKSFAERMGLKNTETG